MRGWRALLAASLALAAAPTAAQDSAFPSALPAEHLAAIPVILTPAERDFYRGLFTELRAGNWAGAAGRLDSMRSGPLHDLARAMLYTMPGSPRVELLPLIELLGRARDLPQAAGLARLARLRNADARDIDIPNVPEEQRLFNLPGQPRRGRPRSVRGDPIADRLENLVQPLLVADQPYEAETLFNERKAELSEEARTSFQQRIAWVYFLNGHDRDVRRMVEGNDGAGNGATEWAVHARWVAGLAAWRLQDFAAANEHFRAVGNQADDIELAAAGHYWAARAEMAGGRPQRVEDQLQAAARHGETFYGLLAQTQLGSRNRPEPHLFDSDDARSLARLPNARAAIALVEIGENRLADELIRHQARIGDADDHEALLHLTARVNLTGTQMWLAHNGPPGSRTAPQDRYPLPSWRPADGWRVDPSLAVAHALQESNFRPDAVSPAGARGLMQVRPGTAGDLVRWRGIAADRGRLNDPANNIAFGQAYLEWLRDQPVIDGLLPRVIAAYNAGPLPVTQWTQRFDQSDPLLFIETIPYWETRGYVPIVLRNYWIYEQRRGAESPSRRALVAGMWPRFPGMPGPSAIRIEPRRTLTAMGSD
ncbi:MAG: lytic transglycosylase domain-containing protein [Sphingosinicella sp.]